MSEIASGWVRLVGSNGAPVAIRISSISKVVGPYPFEQRWAVRIISPDEITEPVGFERNVAEQFVEYLLHDD